jgi:hypothetical protein
MRCEDVIRELAAPTGEPDQAAMAQHLASCSACSGWARRAAQLDALWDATRPPEPASEAWDSVWASIARELDAPATVAGVAAATARPSRNGHSSKVVVHPAPAHPAAHRRPWRLTAIAVLGLGQAAAILIALGLVGRSPIHDPAEILHNTPFVQQDIPPRPPVPSVVRVSLPVQVEAPVRVVASIDEGCVVMIRAGGPAPQVVEVTGPERDPRVDRWWVMFNEVESMPTPRVAAR